MHSLKELGIDKTGLSDPGCEALAPLAPTLTSLMIGSPNLTHLQGLRWVHSQCEAAGCAASVAYSCTKIQWEPPYKFAAQVCSNPFPICLSRHLTRLEKLSINGCPFLTEPSLQGVLRHLTKLSRLDVCSCPFVSAKGLMDVVLDLPNIEYVAEGSYEDMNVLLDCTAVARAFGKKVRQVHAQTAQLPAAFDERFKYSRAELLGITDGREVATTCPPALQNWLLELGISNMPGREKQIA